MINRKFVLCIGASKSGTTWLYNYLKSYVFADMGLRKEYNALGSIFELSSSISFTASPQGQGSFADKVNRDRAIVSKISQSIEGYGQYFDSLLQGDTRLTGDISPSYIDISSEQLSCVRNEFLSREIEPIIVLLLRDPIERILSFARMAQRFPMININGRNKRNSSFSELVESAADNIFTDYQKIILQIEDSIPKSGHFIFPYERLISTEGIMALSRTFDFPPISVNFERRFNNNPACDELLQSGVNVKKLYHRFSDQYDFCNEYFRFRGIDSGWRQRSYD
jgi:hypothetical protein